VGLTLATQRPGIWPLRVIRYRSLGVENRFMLQCPESGGGRSGCRPSRVATSNISRAEVESAQARISSAIACVSYITLFVQAAGVQ